MNPQEKPVILIADDSRVVRVSLKNILKNDCKLIEAEDGQQAWEQLLETPDIRLIFSDLGMPKVDGRELLQKIRNSEITRIRNIPFIVVTGNEADEDTRDELQNMGATEVVSKPFDPARIVSFVSTLTSSQESDSYMLLPEDERQSQSIPNVSDQQDFMQSASKELSFAIRNKNELAIALLRIDQFDQLTSHYSGPAIEHILMTTAEVIRTHIHPDDTMAYFGDGIFAMLRPASNAIGTRYIGRRIIEDLAAKQFYLGESDDLVTASIGVSAPHIRPGIRLRELLLLAEGRLKAAIDLGGNRVIDKGNDTLTPVGLSTDSAPGQSSDSPTDLHTDSILSSHLGVDSVLSRGEPSQRPDTQEMEDKILQLESKIEALSSDNKDLQGQIERWRKQSGDTEQFRQRVFELESEQQQMQVKLNELIDDNERLRKRAFDAETAHQALLDKEQEQNLTLQQANQFYEQENLRLEGQMEALNNRAQKAELAYRKSEQLVISLKDNIKLMRSQMEQVQRQLDESQKRPELQPPADDAVVDVDTAPVEEEETYIEQRTDSELMIDGFPSSKPVKDTQEEPAPVIQLFAEPSQSTSQELKEPAAKAPPAAAAPVDPMPPQKPDISIPAYRAPVEEEKFRDRKPLSSFAIASIIMLVLLCVGFGYLYLNWQDDPVEAESATDAGMGKSAPDDAASGDQTGKPLQTQTELTDQARTAVSTPVSEQSKPSEVKQTPLPASPQASDAVSTERADEEARLQAELTLRQMAEEEFRMRLQETAESAPAQSESTLAQQPEAAVPATSNQPAAVNDAQASESLTPDQFQEAETVTDSVSTLSDTSDDAGSQVTE